MDLVLFHQGCDRVKGLRKPITLKIKKMARQHDSKLTGTVNNLIFYKFRGEYYMRAKPVSVKRTRASVRSGYNFGKASRISRQIRDIIQQINPCKSDKRMMYRFTGALNKYIGWQEKQDPASPVRQNGLPFIQGFQFNEQADLSSIMAIRVSISSSESGLMEIRFAPFVPGEALQAPYNTDHISLKWVITSTNLATVETGKPAMGEMRIPYVHDLFQPPVISIPAIAKPDNMMLMVLAVQYMVNKKNGIELLGDFKKLPCGVVWAGRWK
jgi:hypothetical protein